MASPFQHTSAAIGKVGARKQEYKDSFAPGGTDYYKTKTRKNAYVYITATSEKYGSNTLPSSKNTFDDLYANEEGKPDVILNSVKITEGSDFGMLRTVDGAFTCLSRAAFETYEKTFLRPSSKLKVNFGYTDGTDSVSLSKFVIAKYSYELNDKNQYVCSFKAYGPGPFVNQLDMQKAWSFNKVKFKKGFFEYPVTTFPQYLKYVAQGNGTMATSDIPDGEIRDNGVLVLDNPNAMTPDGKIMKLVYKALQAIGFFGEDASKLIYCNLQWFVKKLNANYLASNVHDHMAGTRVKCDSSTTKQNDCPIPEIGSAYPFSIVLPGGSAGSSGGPGYYGSHPHIMGEENINFTQLVGTMGVVNSGRSRDFSKILLSHSYIAGHLFGKGKEKGEVKAEDKSTSTGNKKEAPKYSLKNMFDTLFSSIYHATGGLVQLATQEDPFNSKVQLIVSKGGSQDSIAETTFDPINGDGITRKSTIKCDVPADDAYAVANGGGAGPGGYTASDLAEKDDDAEAEKEEAKKEAKETIKSEMEFGLATSGFDNENCDSLAAAFKTLVECASKEEAAKLALDRTIWPLELSITLDGTKGFRFGDVINTTFLPPAYRRSGTSASFVVLEATHTIANNDWSTSLKSQCHLLKK